MSAEHFDRRLCREEEVTGFLKESHVLETLQHRIIHQSNRTILHSPLDVHHQLHTGLGPPPLLPFFLSHYKLHATNH